MSDDIIWALAACMVDPPDDLIELYAVPPLVEDRLGINILPLSKAIEYTTAMFGESFFGDGMELFVLDDASDSNPFCYIANGPCRGCILHLYHDGDTAIEYPSLAALLAAMRAAIAEGIFIDDLPGKDFRPAIDQRSLCDRISQLIPLDTDDSEFELLILIQVLDTEQVETVRSLSRHPRFFVREATARLLAKYPNFQLVEVAELLARDSNSQVAEPGRLALSAVQDQARRL